MNWSKRSEELELIDLGHYSQEEYRSCLDNLDLVGKYLGGDKATFAALKELSFVPETLLDVGCGGGGFTKKLSKHYQKVHGIDISPEAIKHAIAKNSHAIFTCQNLADMPSKSYDVVLATLVCHHLTDSDLLNFLKEALRVAKKNVIINDLHRHPLAWWLFSLVAPLLFRDRLITHDGRLSIKRAFTRKDWKRYLKELNVSARITWHWPFRWVVVL